MDNNKLYDNIMKGISKSVKKALNENIDINKFYECTRPIPFEDFLIEYNIEDSTYKKYINKSDMDYIVANYHKQIVNNDNQKWYVFVGSSKEADNIIDMNELHSSLKHSGKVDSLQTMGMGEGDYGRHIYQSGIFCYQGHTDTTSDKPEFYHCYALIAPYEWWSRRGLIN